VMRCLFRTVFLNTFSLQTMQPVASVADFFRTVLNILL
jgi:hypothetical protein